MKVSRFSVRLALQVLSALGEDLADVEDTSAPRAAPAPGHTTWAARFVSWVLTVHG